MKTLEIWRKKKEKALRKINTSTIEMNEQAKLQRQYVLCTIPAPDFASMQIKPVDELVFYYNFISIY